jgi:prolyl oligopeptidase PreP (S9A serine peptidase family)
MDIQHLVDRLEELIDEGRHVPMSKFTLIDEERALEIIDQMRISIPEEVEKANRVLTQRDRILAQANEEASRAVLLARERSEEMLERDSTVQLAQSKAANIIEAARQEAEAISDEADQYVLDTLSALEAQVNKLLGVIRNGINQVATDGSASPNEMGTAISTAQFMPPVQQPVQQAPQRKEQHK